MPWLQLMERSGLLVAVLDRDGRILFASQSLRAACGFADEGLQGRDWLSTCLADRAEAKRTVREREMQLSGTVERGAGLLETD